MSNTPSSNTEGAFPSQGQSSSCLSNIQYFSKHETVKLGESNFLRWKHQILLILEGYELEGFVLGTVSVPEPFVSGPDGQLVANPLSLLHKKQDKFLASWLLSTVTDEVLVHLTMAKISFAVWTAIERRFGAKSNVKISSMRHALYSIKKANLSIKDYLAKVKNLSDPLIAAGSPISEQEQVSVVLVGLSMEYESIHIFASATPMSLDLLTEMLLDCEKRQVDLLTDAPLPQCQLCGKIGHLVQTYYHRFMKHIRSHCCPSTTSSFSHPSSRPSDQVWYPDSGATNHATPDVTSLSNVAPYTCMNRVSMGNGISVPIANVGTTRMVAGSQLLRLQNVLHTPNVCKKLMSVGQFARDNAIYFEFHPFMCFMKDIQTRNTLLVGHMHEGLYRFDVSKPSLPATGVASQFVSAHLCTVQHSSPTELWHRRLGHPCSSVLGVALRNCNISSNNNVVSSICSACQIGKAHKLPFSSSKTMYSTPFKLVASDVWGPSNGFLYYVTFVDMHSRYTWIYFLKSKAEVLQCFLQFKQMVSIQFGRTIKSLQSDWGGEYQSLSIELARLGIQHRVTCPYTSEQNGVAERKHRQVIDMGLTLYGSSWLALGLLFQSAQCVFLGVGTNQKGYKYLDSSGRVFVSKHVTFDESLFPFQRGFSLESSSQVDKSARCQSHFPVVQAEPVSIPVVSLPIPPPISSHENNNGQSLSAMEVPTHSSGAQSSSTPAAVVHSFASPIQSMPLLNVHPMQTRSKSGTFKPKLFTSVLGDEEPTSIRAALQHLAWSAAAPAKYDVVPLPPGRRAVGCKWIFKLKRNVDGSLARYKGRRVVKGYLQEAGMDFQEIFSPVVKPTTIRVVLALAVLMGWSLRQVDINNTFLNGDLQEEIYMVQPPGFEQQGHEGQQLVCRLKKALYGLKQAPRVWFHKLKDFLLTTDFVASKADSSLFVQRSGSQLLFVLVYVDDIIVTGNNSEIIDGLVRRLNAQFSLKDLGQLNYFLGIEKLSRALQYVVITRPDIAYAVNKVCQFMHQPLDIHFKAVKRILRYLHGTLDYGLTFTKTSKPMLEGFSDASWGSDVDDRRSTSGYCVFFSGNPVSWSSKKQQVVSRSSAEAEYKSLAHIVTEMVWIQSLLAELSVTPLGKALKVAQGLFQIGHVPGQKQVADILTKPLSASQHNKFTSQLRVSVNGTGNVERSLTSSGHDRVKS
ncbi:hypothetical protein CXB51_006727 [Gossypium anomalum]|uniref:Integrase catalytic domain-containing protein n=1 Tax=Gossypium anomalum TaxID=47600 RepID=A0A8J5ZGU2_9ROSI|nr:hypothetical protein CXB51_006727 [Gossypium anomalum]